MPNIQSAKKKKRQDEVRTARNSGYKKAVKGVMKSMVKKATATSKGDVEKKGFSIIDKAVKKKVMHKKTAARMKSRLSKVLLTK